MQQKRDLVFNKVIAKAQSLGIFDIIGMYQDWNTELVAQLCSTPLLGEAEMGMIPPSTSALKAIKSIFVSTSFLSLD
jgi:hypothetical protein